MARLLAQPKAWLPRPAVEAAAARAAAALPAASTTVSAAIS